MDTIAILKRNIKLRFNNIFTVIITISQPILWLILYSSIAKETMVNAGITNYTEFILPGLIVLVIFGTCSSSGMLNYITKNNNSFFRILISPVKRSSIVLGQVLEGVLCSYLEVLIMIIISLFLGVKIPLKINCLIIVAFIIFLSGFLISSLTYIISLKLPNEIIYETFMNSLVLPLFFLSSALFPTENLKGIINIMVKLNPFTYVIDHLRYIFINGQVNNLTLFSIVFILLDFVAFLFAIRELNKQTIY